MSGTKNANITFFSDNKFKTTFHGGINVGSMSYGPIQTWADM